MSTYNDDKPQFNMAVLFLERINKRLEESNLSSSQGALTSWYRSLKNIYRTIHFKIDEEITKKDAKKFDIEVNEKILTLFKKIESYLKQQNNKQMQMAVVSNCEVLLDECDQLLNDLLYRYDLIFPKKKFNTFLEEINNDY